MAFENESDPQVTTGEEFRGELQDLVTEAEANGVDVRGGWSLAVDGDGPAWDVEVTRIANQSTVAMTDDEFLASSVTEAVAAHEGIEPTELPPLYDAVDPAALEALQESDEPGQRLTFRYNGYRVTVTSDGSIVLNG